MIAVLESVGGNALARTLLDAVPAPVFLLDEEVRVVGFNAAARHNLGRVHDQALEMGAELLDCILAPPDAVDAGNHLCDGGFVRNLVLAAFSGQNSVREKAIVQLATPTGTKAVQIHVSATLVLHENCQRVLVTVEEPIEWAPANRLVPICAKCKRIRDEKDRWTSLEHYLCNSFGVRLTHGLCQKCLSNSLAEVGLEID